MKRLFIGLLLLAMIVPVVATNKTDQFNLSYWLYKPVSAINPNGTVPLTADWNVGAFDLTCVDMNATNFKLSGVGTLTSALGNVSLTTALTAASGDEVGLYLPVTVNKAAGNYTALKVNVTETGAPGTGDLLMDLQVGTSSKFSVDNAGTASIGSTTIGTSAITTLSRYDFVLNGDYASGAPFSFKSATNKELVDTDGSQAWLYIEPKVNQSGTAGYQALKIDVTETALGSGATGPNSLILAQVGSVTRYRVSNMGFETRMYPLACTHNTATPLFGITIPAGSTAGGVITYTLNVTDNDGSDDQIEVGTVQFCGLQDEANWHTNISEVSTQALESGSLATTWAIDTATADTLKVTLLANSDLTTPVYTLSYTVTFNNSYDVTTY